MEATRRPGPRSPAPARRRVADAMTLGPAAAFASTATGYATTVLPAATRELARWRDHAGAIPDPVLRRQALHALRTRGTMNGAALFALSPPRRSPPLPPPALAPLHPPSH